MTTQGAKTASDMYGNAILTYRAASQTARADAPGLAQAINPSIAFTPVTFTRARLRTVPKKLLFDSPWDTRDPTHATEALIASWTAPPSPSLRQPTTDSPQQCTTPASTFGPSFTPYVELQMPPHLPSGGVQAAGTS